MSTDQLATLDLGIRQRYLTYAELTAQLQAWATAFPTLCRLTSLGATPEGREQWLLTLGPDPDRTRPTVWVDGNMHASEVAGSAVALAIAEDVLRLHLTPIDQPAPCGLSPAAAARARAARYYVLPRISPDGAECVLTTGRFVRSVPRDARVDRGTPRWRAGDVDGDGQVSVMRVVDPTGEFVESLACPGVLVERTVDDAGPFYKLYPEGVIEHWNGRDIPSPHFLGDNPIDLNRNFPWSWVPGHQQVGAGPFPTSEPEARRVVEFTTAHPEIVVWLNLHTFGGVVIRPLGHGPDAKMNQDDLAIFRQLEAWMTEHTGYPTVSGYEEFLYTPDAPLHGDLTDYGYNQRGAIAYVVELWDLFAQLGLPRPKQFARYYDEFGRADVERLATWDQAHNAGRIFRPWRALQHPQLGAVEVGGIDPRVGIWNPPPDRLAGICAGQSAALLRMATLLPAVEIAALTATAHGDDVTLIEVRVENRGYLGTAGLPSAAVLDFNEPLAATATIVDGAGTLAPTSGAHQVLRHLDGWGRGVHSGQSLPAHPWTRGSTGMVTTSWLVRGHGTLSVRVGAARVGFVEQQLRF